MGTALMDERYQILVPEGRFVSIEVVSGRGAEEDGSDWAPAHDPVVTFECWFLASNLTRERPGEYEPEGEFRAALAALNTGNYDEARARLSDGLGSLEKFGTLVVRAVVCAAAPEGWPS